MYIVIWLQNKCFYLITNCLQLDIFLLHILFLSNNELFAVGYFLTSHFAKYIMVEGKLIIVKPLFTLFVVGLDLFRNIKINVFI